MNDETVIYFKNYIELLRMTGYREIGELLLVTREIFVCLARHWRCAEGEGGKGLSEATVVDD
jgi:hypothetical protein